LAAYVILGLAGAAALALGFVVLPSFLSAPVTLSPKVAPPPSMEEAVVEAPPRVLLFYDLSQPDCSACDLHLWRLAYYSFQFEAAGAEVFGVVNGLRNGSTQRDESLAFPWPVVMDLSGRLARTYGVVRAEDTAPTIVVLAGDGRVLMHLRPKDALDRFEGDVLTTIIAATQKAPLDDKVSALRLSPQ